MARDAVAKVNAPRQRRRYAIRVIRQTREKAAQAPDRDARSERRNESASGRATDAVCLFVDLDAYDAANDPARDAVTERERACEVEVQAADKDRARKCAQPQRDEIAGVAEWRPARIGVEQFQARNADAHKRRRDPSCKVEKRVYEHQPLERARASTKRVFS